MGNFAGFQRRIFPHSHQSKISKVPQVFHGKEVLSVHCPSFRLGNSSIGVYQGSQGGEAYGTGTGYQDPPVPRRLVSQSPVSGNLPTSYPDPLGPVPRVGLVGEPEEIRANTKTGFQFRRLPVGPIDWLSLTHSRKMGCPLTETEVHQGPNPLHSQTIHVLDRTSNSNRAFQGGVSLGQILSACHRKAHNTFTQFYLKDLPFRPYRGCSAGP